MVQNPGELEIVPLSTHFKALDLGYEMNYWTDLTFPFSFDF